MAQINNNFISLLKRTNQLQSFRKKKHEPTKTCGAYGIGGGIPICFVILWYHLFQPGVFDEPTLLSSIKKFVNRINRKL